MFDHIYTIFGVKGVWSYLHIILVSKGFDNFGQFILVSNGFNHIFTFVGVILCVYICTIFLMSKGFDYMCTFFGVIGDHICTIFVCVKWSYLHNLQPGGFQASLYLMTLLHINKIPFLSKAFDPLGQNRCAKIADEFLLAFLSLKMIFSSAFLSLAASHLTFLPQAAFFLAFLSLSLDFLKCFSLFLSTFSPVLFSLSH